MVKTLKIPWAPYVVAQRYGVHHGILQVFIIILYEYVFQNPELFRTQVSLSHKQSTLLCTAMYCSAVGIANSSNINTKPRLSDPI
jgi:hypothetical protein